MKRRNMRKMICSMIGGFAFLVTATAAISSDGSSSMEEIVVKGTRQAGIEILGILSPTPLFELPLSASVLNTTSFQERLPKDIADLADYTPGISRRSNYWGVDTPTFQLRGFNAGDATAYYKDGFRYEGRGPLAMANVESVEILRGPQSALYGWNDPGGVVQINVKKPTTQAIREIALQVDAWGKSKTTMDFGGPLDDETSFRFITSREQGGSFRDGQSVQQTLLAPSFAHDLSGGRQLVVSLEWLDDRRTTDYGIPAINGVPADVPVSRIYTEGWGQQHSQSSRLALHWLQPAWEGALSLGLSFYQLKYLAYQDAEPYAVTGTTVWRWYEKYQEQYRWITAYADWSRQFDAGGLSHRFASRLEIARETRSLYGGELDDYPAIDAYSPVYGQAWSPTTGFSVYDQAWTNLSLGIALQDEIHRGDWTWLLGVRVSEIRQVFDYADTLPVADVDHAIQTDRSVTPRLGVSYHVSPTLSLYGNYSAGKLPTLPQSRAFDGSSFSLMSSRQWETGVKAQPINDDWLASAALFDIERNGVLTTDPDHPGYSIQTGAQRSRGVEVEWQGKLARGWRLTTQATWLDSFIEQDNRYAPGNRLPYAPRFGTSAWLTHAFATQGIGRWSLSGGVVYQGERYANFSNSARVPGYARVDTGASYREKRWAVTVAMENVTNRGYYASGVENRPAVIYPGAPRTISMKIAYNFL